MVVVVYMGSVLITREPTREDMEFILSMRLLSQENEAAQSVKTMTCLNKKET